MKAITNSLILSDVRECHARYFNNGIYSSMLFKDSLLQTAHIITNIENLDVSAESYLWRHLHDGCCKYYNHTTKEFDLVLNCNGMIVLTARDKTKISKPILDAVDHTIELEPYTKEQQKLIVHQILTAFMGINYVGGELVLEEIVNQGLGLIGFAIDFLKMCIVVIKSEMLDSLDMEVIEKAKRLLQAPVPIPPADDIPF